MNLDNQNLAEVNQELSTLRDYIRFAVSRFNAAKLYYGHGTDNAWDEAFYLILSALHLPPDTSSNMLDAKLTMVERRNLSELIFRRINERIPAAYLTKESWFAGHPFYVDQRVIIPRSPLAELIEDGFSPWFTNKEPYEILDLGTGSGCIAIACALAFPESHVDAADISVQALEVAAINVRRYHLSQQVQLIHSDLFENITKKYDLILSNPPYLSEEIYAFLPKEYMYEPEIALKTRGQGLEIVKRILKHALKHLTSKGILIVEVGDAEQYLINQFPTVPFLWLDLERGGEGIFLLTYEQLKTYQTLLDNGEVKNK
jgi:ribosomal protein L3 glutamine methyltransferase